ncbi:hypothetical protein WJX84_005451 [Apatococcus fuscideae]|uniref:Uncharacterized protein n=1 Tax=Apatococcus fuscideae TaxID=2026836 RepID=A0AAW1T624_9CHLO
MVAASQNAPASELSLLALRRYSATLTAELRRSVPKELTESRGVAFGYIDSHDVVSTRLAQLNGVALLEPQDMAHASRPLSSCPPQLNESFFAC